MKKLLTLLLLFALAFSLTACGEPEDEEDEENEDDEIAAEEEEEDGRDFIGIWALTMSEGGGTIVNTIFVYPDGIAETVSGVVTIPEGITQGIGPSGQNKGSYEVSGDQIEMAALNGSSTLSGQFTSDTSATGTITSQAGTYGWTAEKTGDLPPEYQIIGSWIISVNGYPGELGRHYWMTFNSDGTVDVTKVKIDYTNAPSDTLNINESGSFTFDGTNVDLSAGSMNLSGTMNGEADSGGQMDGTWTDSDTGDSGGWGSGDKNSV
jgi:hypothetical protein